MSQIISCALVVLLGLAVGHGPRLSNATAANIEIVGIPAWVAENPANAGGGDVGTVSQVGWGGTAAPLGLAGLLFFELPAIPVGEVLISASLEVELTGGRDSSSGQVPDGFNTDLYFLGVRSGATLNKPGDYADSTDPAPLGSVLVEDNWWLAGDDSQLGQSKTLDVTPSILTAYTGGTPNDNFAVFALYGDADLSTQSVQTFFFEQDAANPDLTIITDLIPEPATGPLVAMGSAAIVSSSGRRRARRGRV